MESSIFLPAFYGYKAKSHTPKGNNKIQIWIGEIPWEILRNGTE
jgi:hypothetical protein